MKKIILSLIFIAAFFISIISGFGLVHYIGWAAVIIALLFLSLSLYALDKVTDI